MRKEDTRVSSSFMIWIYLFVSIVGILLVVQRFDGLIMDHDKDLTVDIDNLIAEKMNRSIEYMQHSVDEMATVLSYQDLLEFDQLYDQLTDSIPEADYISIGIVGIDGTVYGLPSEQDEMLKWNLIETAAKTETVSISEPYRSGLTGKLVFTMFSPIYQQGERLGCIFVTYPLSEIQQMANTNVLQDQAEIYLMNAHSNNIILCSGTKEYLIGNWNSTRLMKQQISPETLPAYENWERNILAGDKTGTVQFTMNGVSYTQVYETIDSMENWSVVVRIPNKTLSNTMQQFRSISILFVVILVILSICLILILHKRDATENEKFVYLSNHDALTDVYNRNAFDMVVQRYLDNEGKNEKGALIFLDLDFFKQINDKYGHDIGDKALITLADILKEQFSEDSYIARYGGDEFVLLVKRIESRTALEKRLEKLKRTLRETEVLDYEDSEFEMHYSAGIAAFPENGQNFSDLVKYADLALYEVKEKGRNGYSWYKSPN